MDTKWQNKYEKPVTVINPTGHRDVRKPFGRLSSLVRWSFTKKSLGAEDKFAECCQLPTLQLDSLCLLCALAFILAFFPCPLS